MDSFTTPFLCVMTKPWPGPLDHESLCLSRRCWRRLFHASELPLLATDDTDESCTGFKKNEFALFLITFRFLRGRRKLLKKFALQFAGGSFIIGTIQRRLAWPLRKGKLKKTARFRSLPKMLNCGAALFKIWTNPSSV